MYFEACFKSTFTERNREREVRGRRFPHLLLQPVHAIPESEGISCLLLQPVDFSWGEGSTEQGRKRENTTQFS